jgi:hypothetical protein
MLRITAQGGHHAGFDGGENRAGIGAVAVARGAHFGS